MPTDAQVQVVCKHMEWNYEDKIDRAEASALCRAIIQAAPVSESKSPLMLTVWKDGSYLCQSVKDDLEVQLTTDWFVSIFLAAGYHAPQSAEQFKKPFSPDGAAVVECAVCNGYGKVRLGK